MEKIKHLYRKFTIIETIETSGNSTFRVAFGLLRTPKLNTLLECTLLIDECYRRADEKKARKEKK